MHTLKTLEKIKVEILESSSSYSEFKEKYLGTKGLVTLALKDITSIDKKDRAEYGKQINEIKNICNDILQKKKSLEEKTNVSEKIDPTAPFDINTSSDKLPEILDLKGSKHPLHKEVEIFSDIFKSMGFDILESRQIDDDYHMFESLNFPKGHPARDMYDTF